MTVEEAMKIITESKILLTVEYKKGYYQSAKIDYLADLVPFTDSLRFFKKHYAREVSYIHWNKAEQAIEINCYLK